MDPEKLSALADFYMQNVVKKIPAYIKDSNHIINIVESKPLPQDCLLATIDVKSLYTNIPNKEGIKSALQHLYDLNEKRDDITLPQQTFEEILTTILQQNFFEFDGEVYQQIRGTAMGTRMAPAFANLFMADLEEKILDEAEIKPLVWRRFIDDIFVAWPDTKTTDFMKKLKLHTRDDQVYI